MAAYGGIVLDEEGQPLAGQALSLHLKTAGRNPIATQQTDRSGRFRFAAVPADVPLSLSIESGSGPPGRSISSPPRIGSSNPGEVRENDEVRPRRLGSPAPAARPSIPLAERVEDARRNAHASGHARVGRPAWR